jgi:hypothetical protein
MPKSLSVGGRRLRLSVLFACGVEVAFIVFLTVFLFKHAMRGRQAYVRKQPRKRTLSCAA